MTISTLHRQEEEYSQALTQAHEYLRKLEAEYDDEFDDEKAEKIVKEIERIEERIEMYKVQLATCRIYLGYYKP